MRRKYLIQQGDGGDLLPPDKWLTVRADGPRDAVSVFMRRHVIVPAPGVVLEFYVSRKAATVLHVNGAPICAQKFTATRAE